MAKNLGCSHEMPKDDPRQSLWKTQRDERGFDDTELWSLSHTICEFMVPRLKAFKEANYCMPAGMTMKEWESKIDKMIAAFEMFLNTDGWTDNEQEKVINEGIKEFSEWWRGLWF